MFSYLFPRDSEMAMKLEVDFHQATAFHRPRGPWRISLADARRDAFEQGLGSWEPDGWYNTVPGHVLTVKIPAELILAAADLLRESAEPLPLPMERRAKTISGEMRSRSPGRQSKTALRR